MKKYMLYAVIALGIWVLSIGVNSQPILASEVSTIDSDEDNEPSNDDALDILGWSNKDLLDYVSMEDEDHFDDEDESDVNEIGSLELTKGFKAFSIATFSEDKALSGTASSGTIVAMNTFYIGKDEDEEDYVTIQQGICVKIGASGLFSESVSLDYVGDNYVLIAVKDPSSEQIFYQLYKVTRKEEETKNQLENMQVDFWGDSE